MKNLKTTIFTVIVLVIFSIVSSTFFKLTEGRQAIITQFGRPVGNPITTAGLHFKLPFIQKVTLVDKRILSWDGYPNQIPTKDKKYIHVDTTARFRVIDALKFIQTVQNERGAKARLDAILDSTTRDVISNHNLVEAVRNSNSILNDLKIKAAEQKKNNEVDNEVIGEIEEIQVGREQLSEMIAKAADIELRDFGISIIDVQLRRISYEKSVETKVYERMISERQRVAQKIRSIGQGEKAKIEGRLARDLRKIESLAYKESQEIRGKAEAKSTVIYAKTLGKDPKFFEFIRSMEAYKASLGGQAKFILSNDSQFLKWVD
jgi:modulator of FtsH protease HflC